MTTGGAVMAPPSFFAEGGMSRTWAYTMRDGAVHGEIFASAEDVPAGWTDSPARVSRSDEVMDGKDELIAQAEALGLDVDRRYGAARLRAMIAEAKADDDRE